MRFNVVSNVLKIICRSNVIPDDKPLNYNIILDPLYIHEVVKYKQDIKSYFLKCDLVTGFSVKHSAESVYSAMPIINPLDLSSRTFLIPINENIKRL